MSKDELLQKMNSFMARPNKSEAERKIEARLVNGSKQLDEAQQRLSALEQEKAKLEAAQVNLRCQMQAMWDLALEYQVEADAAVELTTISADAAVGAE